MQKENRTPRLLLLSVSSSIFLFGCASDSSMNSDELPNSSVDEPADQGSEVITGILDPDLFVDGALVTEVTTEPCTLSGGTSTTCYRITFTGEPADSEIGPFCPPNISSDASEGGIWFDGNGEVYDIDGDFIATLDTLYGNGWLLYDPATGEVNITDTQASCEGAARPNVDAEYQNHCVECDLDYFGGGVSQTFLIPVTPVPLANPDVIRTDIGVTLNGVAIAPSAPVDAILSNYTIAAFDDCGGHINPFEGYHYHAATSCTETTTESDGHASLIGYVLDGYPIYAMKDAAGNEETDLDECRGHSDDTRGYHYHAASIGENMFIGCFAGEQGEIQ